MSLLKHDLIAFLRASQAPNVAAGPPLDIGTEPGLIEPDR